MLYIIAGASLSGKTSARFEITRRFAISGIDSDTLRTMTNDLRPDITVGHMQDTLTNYRNLSPVIEAFIHARSFFSEDYVLEGDSINLDIVRKAQNTVKCVVVGYPSATLVDRLQLLQNVSVSHWSRSLTESELSVKLTHFIEYSRFLQQEAEKYGFPFLDLSAIEKMEEARSLIIAALFAETDVTLG